MAGSLLLASFLISQLFKEYIMSEPDVARVSNESEAYVLIEESTEEDMQTEVPVVEEEIAVSKVRD